MSQNKNFNLFPITSNNVELFDKNNFKSKPDKKVSENIKLQIVKELIEPMYINDVKNIIQGKKCWRLTGQIFETMSKILVAIGGIISFSSGYYNNPTLSFVAGSVSTVSLATLQFSSFSYGENKKQSSELNILLEKLEIDSIPELNRQIDISPSCKEERELTIPIVENNQNMNQETNPDTNKETNPDTNKETNPDTNKETNPNTNKETNHNLLV